MTVKVREKLGIDSGAFVVRSRLTTKLMQSLNLAHFLNDLVNFQAARMPDPNFESLKLRESNVLDFE
jgi:hypothetical protein